MTMMMMMMMMMIFCKTQTPIVFFTPDAPLVFSISKTASG